MKNQWLLDFRMDVTSEHGEDGIIEKIFEVLGEGGRWCVELGALNGKHDSNTWNLVRNKGWNAVLIEADQTYFERLLIEHEGNERVHALNAFISFEGDSSLDAVFRKTSLPKEFDLFVLDIDGNDYHIWESLEDYRPNVMVIEFNPSIPDAISFIQPRDMNVYQGSSLKATVELGKKKGYELICVCAGNAFFVDKALFSKFGIEDNSIEALHADHSYETQIFQLYDGTLKLAGKRELIWHKRPIREEEIQVLPQGKREYPAKISGSKGMRAFKYWVRKQPWYAGVQKIRKAAFK